MYQQRREAFAAAELRSARRDRMLTHVRLAVFLLAAALFGVGWFGGQGGLWYGGGGAGLAAFLVLVQYHEYVQRQRQRLGVLRQINEQALARLRRDWTGLAPASVDVPPEHRAVADDLDLFGHASLFHFVCSANTPLGLAELRDWLLQPASPAQSRPRQQAVMELAPRLEFRESLNLEGRLLADRGRATLPFIAWAEGGPWLTARPWLVWLCRIVPAGGVLSVALTAVGVMPVETGFLAVVGVLLVNVLLSALFLGPVHDIFSRIRVRSGEIQRYLALFQLLHAMPATTEELDAIRRDATALGGGALRRLRQLNWIALLASMPQAQILVFLYLPLQFAFLYDFHVLNLLEAWQRRFGGHARRWFVALGRLEALSSLATLAYDYPDWALPEVSPSADRLEGRQLGHPLLPDEARVANDVEIGPAGSVLLVTGSNMSGKSTLLRAIGVNAVLAQAGAPVCAGRLTMPAVALATSMRIRDSLEDGISFYMAELMRLKQIVDLARDPQRRAGRMLLYLLDEILLGTNSRERHLAVVRVLEHLLAQGAVGAVSTHDLELATNEPLAGVCRCVHFCETLHGQHAERPMTFDYRLRPGLATTTNALRLLEIVGLGPE